MAVTAHYIRNNYFKKVDFYNSIYKLYWLDNDGPNRWPVAAYKIEEGIQLDMFEKTLIFGE